MHWLNQQHQTLPSIGQRWVHRIGSVGCIRDKEKFKAMADIDQDGAMAGMQTHDLLSWQQ